MFGFASSVYPYRRTLIPFVAYGLTLQVTVIAIITNECFIGQDSQLDICFIRFLQSVSEAVRKARIFLEQKTGTNDIYKLSIMSYALALIDSPEAGKVIDILFSKAITHGETSNKT